MDGQETKDVGSKKIFRGSKFQVEGEKNKIKYDFLLNFNINDQTPNFRNVKTERKKKKKKKKPTQIPQLKKKVCFGKHVCFFPCEIFSEISDIT